MLSTSWGLHAAAKWLIGQGVLQQFQTAYKIQQEDIGGYAPLQPLKDWRRVGEPLGPLITP